MSKYVTESINLTTDCRMFRPHTSVNCVQNLLHAVAEVFVCEFCTQLTKAYVAEMPCNQLFD